MYKICNFTLLSMVFGTWANVKGTVSAPETWSTYCLELTSLLVVHTEESLILLYFRNEILFGFQFTQEIYSPNKVRKTKQTSALDRSWWLKAKAGPVSVEMGEGGPSWPATWLFSIPKHTNTQGSVFISVTPTTITDMGSGFCPQHLKRQHNSSNYSKTKLPVFCLALLITF